MDWIARVASASNIGDDPSRMRIPKWKGVDVHEVQVVLPASSLKKICLGMGYTLERRP